jgi:PAS domain S-box-containing protein
LIEAGQDLQDRYLAGMLRYLAGAGEEALQSAYEMGRTAIAEGLGGLEMLAIHQKCLAAAMSNARDLPESAWMAMRAGNFFAESLSPYEMALRGFREANARLNQNLDELRAAEAKLLDKHSQLLAAHQALEMERRRYRDLFSFAPDGYLVTDLEGRIEEANQAAEALLGVRSGGLAGTRLLEFVVETPDAFEKSRTQLLKDDAGKVQDWQFDIKSRNGAAFPATLSVRVVRNASGSPVSVRWLLRDNTERKRMEEERAGLLVREQVARAQSESAQRFAFLAEIGVQLVASLDCETTLESVARRVVPYLADWCLVYLVEPDARIRLLCAADADPTRRDLANQLARVPIAVAPDSRMARLLSDGRAQTFSEAPDGLAELFAEQPELFSFLVRQDMKSLALIPMQTQGNALGLIVLAAVQPDCYQGGNLALAEDLACRCALAAANTRLYRAMIAERDKATEASLAKDEFLAILSHELRNPLVPILGWARNFRTNRLVAENPVLNQGVESIERNARNMVRLTDDCLDLVRISERRVTLEKELLDLNQIVQGSIQALSQMAQEDGLRLATSLSDSSLWVFGDRARLDQVVNNLLINAIKYTEAGGLVSIRSAPRENQAEIDIEDTGIGIAPEFLEQIFQPFRRGSQEWLTSDAGLGLGLTIARRIVEMHDGSIWAESPGLGGGSTFHLRLRLASGEPAASAPVLRAPQAAIRSSHVSVLLIDDQKDVTDLIKMDLESLGYKVLTATDGQTGLEMAIREVPDVIVSDVKMPRMDGYELIQKVRGVPALASVPMVALTGFGMKKDADAARTAGYAAYLTKPVESSELSVLIESLTRQRSALRP